MPVGRSCAFAVGTGLNAAFVAGEALAGLLTHSVALLADTAHNLGDVLGLILAWAAASLSRRRPSRKHTYGLGRSSILAALVNAVVLLISIGAIAVAAVQRLLHPEASGSVTVMAVAALGILVNGGTALLFMRGQADLNTRAAFLHMATDAAVSAGVVIAGLAMLLTGWAWIDPVTSLLIAAMLLFSSWRLLRESVDMAMDAVPHAIDHDAVEACLRALPGVRAVHDLHIWALSTNRVAMTAHLVRADAERGDAFLSYAHAEMRNHFGISHATFQIECGDHPCDLASAEVV